MIEASTFLLVNVTSVKQHHLWPFIPLYMCNVLKVCGFVLPSIRGVSKGVRFISSFAFFHDARADRLLCHLFRCLCKVLLILRAYALISLVRLLNIILLLVFFILELHCARNVALMPVLLSHYYWRR